MSSDLELKLGRIASLAHRARVTLSKGCFSIDPEGCDGNCGGHAAVGWSLDPREVLAGIVGDRGGMAGGVIDLVVERDRLAGRVEILADGLRALAELDAHAQEDCPICPGRRNGCSEVRDLRGRVEAAREFLRVSEVVR